MSAAPASHMFSSMASMLEETTISSNTHVQQGCADRKTSLSNSCSPDCFSNSEGDNNSFCVENI
jgi:hypothetical protein